MTTLLFIILSYIVADGSDSFRVLVDQSPPTPRDGAKNVTTLATLRLHFSAQVDPETLVDPGVRLIGPDGAVPVFVQSDGTGGVVTVTPTMPLETGELYQLQCASSIRSTDDRPLEPFRLSFTTTNRRPQPDPRFVCKRQKLADHDHNSAMVVGQDGCLYVADTLEEIMRYRLDRDTGLATGAEVAYQSRGDQIVGLCFDPTADAQRLVLWISHARYKSNFTGTISKLTLPPFGSERKAVRQDYITGLPHDVDLHHQPNGIEFGPDGRLYQSVGGVTTLRGTPNWGLRETPLSAAIVVADVNREGFAGGKLPCNVQTAPPVGYDPLRPDAPVQVYATESRNAYDLCWHSGGHLFAATNQNSLTRAH